MTLWLWARVASASDDLSVTSVGADATRAMTIGEADANFLLGQRLRWTVAKNSRVLVDGRFSLDPNAAVTFQESRLRELGVAYETQGATLLAGRHPVVDGGPRLVDGLQGVANVGADHQIALGGWAGLVPDEFTTAPTSRFGGGPILAYTRPQASVSAVGDFVFGGGGVSRLGTLVLARGEVGSRFEADGRLDWLLADGNQHSGLADGQVFLQVRPDKTMRIEGLYDGYSSLLYQSQADQNPHVTRFAQRIEDLGLTEGITQDQVDPTLYHLLGLSFADHATGDVRPQVGLRARTLLSPADPTKQYSRLGATAGIAGLAGERLELDVDGNVLFIDQSMGSDFGLLATIEPDPDGALAIDTSVRLLLDPAEFQGYPGWYADLFLDLMSRSGTSLDAGVSWSDEPSDLVGQDVGISGFLRLQQWVRPGRPLRGALGDDSRDRARSSEGDDSTSPKKGESS